MRDVQKYENRLARDRADPEQPLNAEMKVELDHDFTDLAHCSYHAGSVDPSGLCPCGVAYL